MKLPVEVKAMRVLNGRLLPLAILLVACGAPKPALENVESETAGTEGSEKGGETDTIAAEEGGCPATMKEATGYCVEEGAKYVPTVCQYPEGSCRCGPPEHCGGMAPEPVPMQEYTWQCSTPPPDVLPDGCPGSVPPGGTPCDDEGKVCWTGKCCVQKLECVNGQWQVGAPLCPP
jgi:hypothetical protein